MGLKKFDKKFGQEFLSSVPDSPGVYFIHDQEGTLIYVGKAKRLRRRLAQYRNAKRCKKGRKMRLLVDKGHIITWDECASDLDACLREIRCIQEFKPKRNIAGAFSFRYPLIGLQTEAGMTRFLFTTLPDSFPGYEMHGAFRSRFKSAEAFFSLMRLLKFLGHLEPSDRSGTKYSYVFCFRRLPDLPWSAFFRGESMEALEELALRLLSHAGARAKAGDVQEDLRTVRRFWKEEAKELADAMAATGYSEYPVPQASAIRYSCVTVPATCESP